MAQEKKQHGSTGGLVANSRLRRGLNRLCERFDERHISPDPLQHVRRFKRREDQEIAGLIASVLAYGNVNGIVASVERILSIMKPTPYDFVMGFAPQKDSRKFAAFKYRFTAGSDVASLIRLLQLALSRYGTLEQLFLKRYSETDENIRFALEEFVDGLLALGRSARSTGPSPALSPGLLYLLPSPRNGSPCKRLNLYLRWMVRRDRVDLGVWSKVSPSKLVIPLDTHVVRVSRNIGLTTLKSPSWKMAEQITDNLRKLDPHDPVKYDFALSRLGILAHCPTKMDARKCRHCQIKELCTL